MVTEAQAQDVLLGVLYGDCLGAQYEFSAGPLVNQIRVGPSTFGHPAGRGTDDTETTIAVAEGLVEASETGRSATRAIADRLVAWHDGNPPDVGGTTADGLRAYRRTGNSATGSTTPRSVANGSLMRSAPFALIAAGGAELAVESSRTTHAHPEVLTCVRAYVHLIGTILEGTSVAAADVMALLESDPGLHPDTPLQEIPCAGMGHAVYAFDLAIWAATRAGGFTASLTEVIRLGGDTDTNGAICGAVLAARFGFPAELEQDLDGERVDHLRRLAGRLVSTTLLP